MGFGSGNIFDDYVEEVSTSDYDSGRHSSSLSPRLPQKVPTSRVYHQSPDAVLEFAKDRSFGVDKVNPWVTYYPDKGRTSVCTWEVAEKVEWRKFLREQNGGFTLLVKARLLTASRYQPSRNP